MSKPKKAVRVDLYEDDIEVFDKLKDYLGIRSDADVLRYAIRETMRAIEKLKK